MQTARRTNTAPSRRNTARRRKKRSIFGPVIAFLVAAVLICAIGTALMRLLENPPVEYPMLYTAEITAAAAGYSVPAPLIASIIMAESSYRPDVVNSIGAAGLMQIMPDTGAWIAGKFGDEFTADMLTDPAVSIRYGSWYLGFLMDRYSGDMVCAVAAYHAGQGTVDKWLKDPAYSADGLTLSYIPYDSTRTYTERVLKYYEYYETAYENITVP